MSGITRGDLFAKIIGFFVMLLGLAVIGEVLWLAFGLYNDRDLGLGTGPTATDLGVGFVKLVLRIVLLFLGSFSGSLIANKGIRLYFSGIGPPGSPPGPAITERDGLERELPPHTDVQETRIHRKQA